MHGAGHWIAFLATNRAAPRSSSRTSSTGSTRSTCAPSSQREGVNFLQLVGDAFGRPIVEEMETGRCDVSSLFIVLSGGAALSAPVEGAVPDACSRTP